MNTSDIVVSRLQSYNVKDAAEIGHLMPYLSKNFTDTPIAKELLTHIITSPYHEQLVARYEDKIVGTATLTLIMGAGAGKKGWLEDFVTDQNSDIKGIGQHIWNEMGRWCLENNVDLNFTSNPRRVAAHDFYKGNGATIRDTDVFLKKF